MRFPIVICILALLVVSQQGASAQTDQTLQTQIARFAATHHGKLALYATDIRTGKSIALDADTSVPTGSSSLQFFLKPSSKCRKEMHDSKIA
ncbi:MAG: hypothetical protein NVSMB31_14940 [Vulcanimicrobiaceae bacterium]